MARPSKKKRLEAMDVVAAVVLTFIALLVAFPFWTALVTSLVDAASYARNPVQLYPHGFTLKNYQYILEYSTLMNSYGKTIIVVVTGFVYAMFISLTMAYGLSFRQYPGKRFFFVYVLVTMYFSGGLLPTYLLMKNLGLVDSLVGIVLLCGVSTFNVVVIKNGIEQLPESLSEAARIDGANDVVIFVRIILPLITPIIATFGLFIAVGYWNEWFWSMLLLTDNDAKTLQIVLRTIVSNNEADFDNTVYDNTTFNQGIKMAAVMVVMLPVMVIYPFIQKYFAKGMLVGAIKM